MGYPLIGVLFVGQNKQSKLHDLEVMLTFSKYYGSIEFDLF